MNLGENRNTGETRNNNRTQQLIAQKALKQRAEGELKREEAHLQLLQNDFQRMITEEKRISAQINHLEKQIETEAKKSFNLNPHNGKDEIVKLENSLHLNGSKIKELELEQKKIKTQNEFLNKQIEINNKKHEDNEQELNNLRTEVTNINKNIELLKNKDKTHKVKKASTLENNLEIQLENYKNRLKLNKSDVATTRGQIIQSENKIKKLKNDLSK